MVEIARLMIYFRNNAVMVFDVLRDQFEEKLSGDRELEGKKHFSIPLKRYDGDTLFLNVDFTDVLFHTWKYLVKKQSDKPLFKVTQPKM